MSNLLIKYTLLLVVIASTAFAIWSVKTSDNSSTSPEVTQVVTCQKAPTACARIQEQAEASENRAADSNKTAPKPPSTRRSFSFHYLDVLEWLFSGSSEAAKQHRPQPPSTSNSA